jgi:hypothetical protein
MESKKVFEGLMRTRYEHWDNHDIPAYGKSLADDVVTVFDSEADDHVEHHGKAHAIDIITLYRQSLDADEYDGFRHEIKSYNYVNVKADRIEAEVKMNLWQRVKGTQEWKQQLMQNWPVKKLRSGRYTLNAVAELRNGEWLITQQKYSSED